MTMAVASDDSYIVDVGRAMNQGRPMGSLVVRPVRAQDHEQWKVLWDGYNAFYGRSGDTAVPPHISESTWRRFLDPDESVRALVAVLDGEVAGIAHYLFHRSTNHIENLCYLEDLFTAPSKRARGIGRALIHAVYDRARAAGCSRVYWMTHETNATAIALYATLAERSGFIVFKQSV
jgi:GNAT superfamily N-acetyltransferase